MTNECTWNHRTLQAHYYGSAVSAKKRFYTKSYKHFAEIRTQKRIPDWTWKPNLLLKIIKEVDTSRFWGCAGITEKWNFFKERVEWNNHRAKTWTFAACELFSSTLMKIKQFSAPSTFLIFKWKLFTQSAPPWKVTQIYHALAASYLFFASAVNWIELFKNPTSTYIWFLKGIVH